MQGATKKKIKPLMILFFKKGKQMLSIEQFPNQGKCFFLTAKVNRAINMLFRCSALESEMKLSFITKKVLAFINREHFVTVMSVLLDWAWLSFGAFLFKESLIISG